MKFRTLEDNVVERDDKSILWRGLLDKVEEHLMIDYFIECDTCHKKPDMGLLCGGCLSNRALIERQRLEIEQLKKVLAEKGVSTEMTKYGMRWTDNWPGDEDLLKD